jgi:hypothetical protein
MEIARLGMEIAPWTDWARRRSETERPGGQDASVDRTRRRTGRDSVSGLDVAASVHQIVGSRIPSETGRGCSTCN